MLVSSLDLRLMHLFIMLRRFLFIYVWDREAVDSKDCAAGQVGIVVGNITRADALFAHFRRKTAAIAGKHNVH